MTEIDVIAEMTEEIGTMISSVKNNPVSLIGILTDSIRYNPTVWIVVTIVTIASAITFVYGLLRRRKDYIVLSFFLLFVSVILTILFYALAVSGFKIEFIR